MTSSQTQLTFKKTAACPASSILLSYRLEKLSRKGAAAVKKHLSSCDFCSAELPLLAHHKPGRKRPSEPPEIPINLRSLAEAIL
ncbi:MAG TPA: hypothetical protein VGW58_18710, partial [Pyrinomonadaceae bacterium]|nr:hypothetical protein [Pyrinomonadaceae bacterium]